MKIFLLLFIFITVGSVGFADNGIKSANELMRHSQLRDPAIALGGSSSYPMPFSQTNNLITSPAVSTGYYFVDSDDDCPDKWKASPAVLDTTDESAYWHRILQGPRIVPKDYWASHPEEGLRFFRNPYYPTGSLSFFDDGDANATDSTDDAFAGPIPLNFNFYFNGIRYDSFYVSSNGIVALTNRRYTYSNGVRSIPSGQTTCYDTMSADWFIRGSHGGNGFNDVYSDNFGYSYSVCGNAERTSPTAGIRSRSNGNGLQSLSAGTAVIAPFWADGQLSQYSTSSQTISDFGQVWYKRSADNNKIIIYFINYMLKGTLSTPYGSFSSPVNARAKDANYTSAKAQVILDNKDSSVLILYENFAGSATVAGKVVPSKIIFRYNTTAGVRGFARHTNYGQSGGPVSPWSAEYEQYTHYYTYYQSITSNIPHEYLAVKFKQWKNPLRVVDVQYRVRKQDKNADLSYSEIVTTSTVPDYEILAGEEKIGTIQPVALIQNVSNLIQGPNGVNFTPQNVNFTANCKIVNLSSGKIVYNKSVQVDSTCLATCFDSLQNCTGDPNVKVRYSTVILSSVNYTATNYAPRVASGSSEVVISPWTLNGIPPYGFVQVYFPPFEPNEFVESNTGRMRTYISFEPSNPKTGGAIGEQWPFDDTTSARLFVMKRLNDLSEDFNVFHFVEGVPMPSVNKWVNIDADVVSGDYVSKNPCPPRGKYLAKNYDTATKANFYEISSPALHINRLTLSGDEPLNSPGGDQIRSFPINLINPLPRYNSVLSFSIQRSTKSDNWPRGWCDQMLIAPEPRTMSNTSPLMRWNPAQAASATGDEIDVEFAQPSPDGIQYITNIPESRWRNHPGRGGRAPITNAPDYALWGSNGYFRGYLETDKDSSLAVPTTKLLNGYRPNGYDDGIDFYYQKGYVLIPDTIIKSAKQGAKNFRFRIAVKARKDLKCSTCIPDDADDFFVDNISLLYPSECTDLGVSAIGIKWPYSMAPASQATNIPVEVLIANNSSLTGATFMIHVRIFKGKAADVIPLWNQYKDAYADHPKRPKAVYCRTETPSTLNRNIETPVQMPNWNARLSGPGTYTILAYLEIPGMDLVPDNDTTYSEVTINFGDCFAYDPVENPQNDVPVFTSPFNNGTPIYGSGLNLSGYPIGGMGTNVPFATPPWILDYETGVSGGDGSGQIAMKFVLTNADTLKGYQAYFGGKNSSPDDISFAAFKDKQDLIPDSVIIPNSKIYRQRAVSDLDSYKFSLNSYVTYLYPKSQPIILSPGIYWIAIGQLGQTGFELGGSAYNMGMRTTNYYYDPCTYVMGQSGYSMMIDKNFRRVNPKDKTTYLNNNLFCFENTIGSDTWYQFMPNSGNPAYPHLNHAGQTTTDGYTLTASRGTWIPMIHPYFGARAHGKVEDAYQDCGDPTPVELTSFDAVVRNNSIDLFWETASEIQCKGFYIEKRLEGEEQWNTFTFVGGHGNSNCPNTYNFSDKKVYYGQTYQYRLVQVDFDGTQSCPLKDILTITMDKVGKLTLSQNAPNPFTNITLIDFVLPEEQFVKVDVIDIYGTVVNTLCNNILGASKHQFDWDGKDDSGRQVPSGVYILKVSTKEESATIKMTLLR
ncbi:MAG: T9SS type A sorting domain-containing protein [Candidatus Kapabacteria bacterium]|nr:T9SS type A sorting domain-containing protein [Candidatus Kapabacteria bacterium]